MQVAHSKPGKHGTSKAQLTGMDIITNKKHVQTKGTQDTIEQPVFEKTEYMLVNVEEDGFVSLLDDAGLLREDLHLPREDYWEDLTKRILKAFEAGAETYIQVAKLMGEERLVDLRVCSK